MALEYQTVEFDLSAPLDESLESAARVVALQKCENGAYDKQGGIHKRPGLLAKTATATLTNVRRLIPHVDGVCAVGTSSAESAFAQHSAAKADWIARDAISEAVVTRRPVVRDLSESYQDCDMAIGLKWIAYIYVRQRTGPAYDTWIRIVDRETGAVLTDSMVAANCRGVRACATPDQTVIALTYVDTGATTLFGYICDADGTGALSGPYTIDTSAKSTIYDIVTHNNTDFYYVGVNNSDDIIFRDLDPTNLNNTFSSFTIAGTFRRPSMANIDGVRFALTYWDVTASRLKIARYTYAGVLATGPTIVDTVGTEHVAQAGVIYDGSVVIVVWSYGITSSDVTYWDTWHPTLGTLGTQKSLFRYRIRSRLFSDATSGRTRFYAWLHDTSGGNALVLTAFSVSLLETRPVATAAFDLVPATQDRLTSVAPGDTGKYRIGALTAVLATEALAAVDDLEADFSDTDLFSAAVFGPTTYIAGGVLQQISGHYIDEHAFLQVAQFSVADAAGAVLDAGKAYVYGFAYEYIDEYGLLHISTPTFVTFTATDHGGGKGGATLTLLPLTMTRRMRLSRTVPKVLLGVYRSRGDVPDVLYRLYTIDATPDALENDPTVTVATSYTDAVTDSVTYTAHRQLYNNGQSGSQLERDAVWGGCRGLCVHKSRMFAWGGEDRERVWYSQEAVAAEPPEFNLAQYVRVPGETVKACASLDDSLIIFGTRGLYAVFGDGPNATGDTASGSFSIAMPIASDTGCNSGQTCTTKRGVYFRGPQGLYLIDRGRNVVYVGAHVEDTVAAAGTLLVITKAESRGEVRFTFAHVTCVYNELLDRWSTFKYGLGSPTVDSALALNGSHYTAVAGDLYIDTESSHADDNLGSAGADFAPALAIQTTELDFASGQEQKRCRRIRAAVRDDHDAGTHSGLQLQIYVDGALGPTDQLTFTAAEVKAEYDALPIGIPKLGFRWKPVHQRFQRMSVVLQEVNPVAPGLTFLGLAFEIGSEGGPRRASATASK